MVNAFFVHLSAETHQTSKLPAYRNIFTLNHPYQNIWTT